MRLGKRPARHDSRDLLHESYVQENLKPPWVWKRQLHEFTDFGMLGNDSYGDCVWAGADHEEMLWTKEGGSPATFTPENALSDYAAVTGFDPATGQGDNGTDVREALNYRRSTGVVDAQGNRHTIVGYTALEVGNVQHVKEAIWLFGAVGLGIQFPSTAMDQFNAGQPWTVVPGAQIEGGHYVPAIGFGPRSVYVVSWGRVVEASWGFLTKYMDEGFALLSAEFLNANRSPAGFSFDQLKQDLASVGQ